VRAATGLVTTVVAAAALLLSWHEGSGSASGPPTGVHVVAPPPAATAKTPSGKVKTPATSNSTAAGAPSGPRSIDGAVLQTPYGDVQVRVVLSGKRITDVQALHLTDANGRSRQISADAAPVLRREALSAQSAQLDTVSGATYTSEGYRQSLQAALDQAHR
jgi:uncharacterized protein with FMN-binding domain